MNDRSNQHNSAPALAKLRRHVRSLVDIGRIAGLHQDLDRFLDQAVLQVARAVEIDHVKILRYRRRTADLLMAAGLGWKDGLVRTAVFPADLKSPPGRSFRTAESVCLFDANHSTGFVISDLLREHGIVSLANVPIIVDGAAWGVLEVDSSTPRDFSEDTIEFLTAAAAIIGATVRRQTSDRGEAAALAQAAAEAQHKETLLRELQHRVKNNFQIILSSIGIQKRRFDNADAHRALDHVANRINAISLAHDQLAPGQNAQAVDVASYLRALCISIEQQMDNVTIDVQADEIDLSIDRAVPLGLILNEAVTNSVKHAFGPEGGRVTVRLQAGVGYGEARMTVEDNGKGFDKPRPSGSGLKLIDSLSRQIGGEVTRESSHRGTVVEVVFPVIS